jgi:hypothetical protein
MHVDLRELREELVGHRHDVETTEDNRAVITGVPRGAVYSLEAWHSASSICPRMRLQATISVTRLMLRREETVVALLKECSNYRAYQAVAMFDLLFRWFVGQSGR